MSSAIIDRLDRLLAKLFDSIDVNVQDQTTPPIIANFSSLDCETTLASATEIDDITITLTDATGFSIGDYISVFDTISSRYYLANVLAVADPVITVDSPLDFAFPIGSNVTCGSDDLAVDGSETPQIFGLRNTEATIGVTFDVTRIIFTCLTDTAANLSEFGDLEALTNGLVLRSKNGIYRNIFNVKTNGDLANIMFDFDIIAALNPAQGQDGFLGRLTFAGANKMGVALRIAPGEDMQLLVRDDLSGLLEFKVIVEGHEVFE